MGGEQQFRDGLRQLAARYGEDLVHTTATGPLDGAPPGHIAEALQKLERSIRAELSSEGKPLPAPIFTDP